MADDRNRLNDEALDKVAGGEGGPVIVYTVYRGDTLVGLARYYCTTVQEIMRMNPFIQDPNVLEIGWKLQIPDCRYR